MEEKTLQKQEALKVTDDWKQEAFTEKDDWKQQAIIIADDSKIPPEEMKYLVLLIAMNDDMEETKIFEWITGRTLLYNTLKVYIRAEMIDLYESKIVAETRPVNEALSVVQYMRHIINKELVDDDSGFDINDYIIGDEYSLVEDNL